MRLSENFSLSELTKSSTASRLGIDNSLDPNDWNQLPKIENLKALAENVLQPIRDHFGIPFSPQSGFRCFKLERILCASAMERARLKGISEREYLEKKQHPKGFAADIEIPGIANLDLAHWIKDNLQFDQLILEFYNKDDPRAGWVHVSYRLIDGGNRQRVLTIGKGGTIIGLPVKGD